MFGMNLTPSIDGNYIKSSVTKLDPLRFVTFRLGIIIIS